MSRPCRLRRPILQLVLSTFMAHYGHARRERINISTNSTTETTKVSPDKTERTERTQINLREIYCPAELILNLSSRQLSFLYDKVLDKSHLLFAPQLKRLLRYKWLGFSFFQLAFCNVDTSGCIACTSKPQTIMHSLAHLCLRRCISKAQLT